MKLVFAGTPDFAVPPLRALLAAGHEVLGVYTQPDRPAGRGRKLRPGPVKQLALEHGLPVHQPRSLRDAQAQAELAALAPELMVVVAYGLILPAEVLAIPALGCLNIHASLLPRWRGAAPIHRALLAGDTRTGVSIMRMDEGLDTGAVLAEAALPIEPEDTTGVLHDKLARLGAELLVESLPAYARGDLPARPQPQDGVSYAEKLSKAEARLDWTRPAEALARQVRAFNPWPVAQFQRQGETFRVWEARALADVAPPPPGRVLAAGREGLDVATGDGVLRLLRLQGPGGKPLAVADFLNGRPWVAGDVLE
ncbi:methionyl-tRNA formyltransferase [Alkalilimnicola sp. S0819]|uniref:methionyl-tRNA formyltransferase n=1 Tax=Alkalilimnicola sp. S0819 TaxID=2613922 RepID=UPI0012627A44|nr:methionyl-tRNA formyltransferase [Alkalilimnicola sp. S0819]KAB7627243.1 methionyl-tRNA formyltransferase [Alkalilimnicola sp. S0819]MPQ15956.1 methionyl-tRNA formyltransferase [Alkalilimnicola sp. S0819]